MVPGELEVSEGGLLVDSLEGLLEGGPVVGQVLFGEAEVGALSSSAQEIDPGASLRRELVGSRAVLVFVVLDEGLVLGRLVAGVPGGGTLGADADAAEGCRGRSRIECVAAEDLSGEAALPELLDDLDGFKPISFFRPEGYTVSSVTLTFSDLKALLAVWAELSPKGSSAGG